MGLRARVYANIELIPLSRHHDFDFDYTFHASVVDNDLLDRIKNLEINRFYNAECVEDLIEYPHSTHNRFREFLLKVIGREDLLFSDGKIDFDKVFVERDLPFYEFIIFPDNEGVMDWETSENLYQDFVKYNFYLPHCETENPRFKDIYKAWLETFETAKDNGVVVFS